MYDYLDSVREYEFYWYEATHTPAWEACSKFFTGNVEYQRSLFFPDWSGTFKIWDNGKIDWQVLAEYGKRQRGYHHSVYGKEGRVL